MSIIIKETKYLRAHLPLLQDSILPPMPGPTGGSLYCFLWPIPLPIIWTAAFIKWSSSPTLVNSSHTDWDRNPRTPSSIVNSQIVHPLSQQSVQVAGIFFLSVISSHHFSYGTVNTTRLFSSWQPHDDVGPQARGQCRLWEVKFPPEVNLHFPSLGCLLEVLPGMVVDYRSLTLFHKGDGAGLALTGRFFLLSWSSMSASTASTLPWYRLCDNAVLHHERMCTIVPLPAHNLHSGSSLIPHWCKLNGVGKVSYTRRRKDMQKASSCHRSLHKMVVWERFLLVQSYELLLDFFIGLWSPPFFLKVSDFILDHGSLLPGGGPWPLLERLGP